MRFLLRTLCLTLICAASSSFASQSLDSSVQDPVPSEESSVQTRGTVGDKALNLSTGDWIRQPGLAKDVGANAYGSVWVIGTGPVGMGGDFGIFHWNGSGWDAIDGGGVRIDVDPSGNPWVVNSKGEIWQRLPTGWKQLPGLARDIGIG